jgi:lipid-A-disaccharide synthase-like uncharacterized protein
VKITYAVIFILGLSCGLALLPLLANFTHPDAAGVDPAHVGLSWGWLAFGYAGQALFTGRMLVQWIATEKRKQSVVPTLFWWLSLFGGLVLLIYFVRRGDPVGILGQVFGTVVYGRNLILIQRARTAQAAPAAAAD